MKALYFYIISILLLSCSSCKKYLDKKSNDALVVPSTLQDLQAVLDYSTNMNFKTPNYMEVTADDYFLLESEFNAINENERNAYRWVPFDYTFSLGNGNDWSFAYYPIYISNLCLERLNNTPKTTDNQSKWDNIKGASLFFRGYYFLMLCWQHAKAYDLNTAGSDLGIVIRLSSNFNSPSVRSSVKESYERVVADSKAAAEYLPDNPLHPMRPSKASAYGLLARAYLSMQNYDSAYKYANLCLNIKNDLIDYNSIDLTSSTPFEKFNRETIFYTQMAVILTPVYNFSALVDTTLYSSYENGDLRKDAFFAPASGYYKFKGNYTQDYTIFTGIATDEMYLTRAECYARSGDKNSALLDLNTLLSKRWKVGMFNPITAVDEKEALQKVIEERRKELLFRGIRWSDLKRLNKGGANIILSRVIAGQQYNLPPNDSRYALPLPKDVVDNTGVSQN